jgi:hypothetical protein
VPPARIAGDSCARTTWENATFTDPWHLARASAAFRRQNLQACKRMMQHEQRMKQLRSENARLAELNAKLDAILFSSATSSTPPPSTPDKPEM